MTNLKLFPGPRLMHTSWDAQQQSDVTALAEQYLFEKVTLTDGATLDDVLALLEACPILQVIYTRDFSVDLVKTAKHARALLASQCTCPQPQGPYDIEFLELYQSWERDKATSEVTGTSQWQFHGQGYAVTEQHLVSLNNEGEPFGFKIGDRIGLSLSFRPLAELLSKPLRVDLSASVCESCVESSNFGRKVDTVLVEPATLGEVLRGCLWELSFYGTQDDAQAVFDQITQERDQVLQNLATQSKADDVQGLCSGAEPDLSAVYFDVQDLIYGADQDFGINAVFSHAPFVPGQIDPVRWREVRSFMHCVPDEQCMAQALRTQFGDLIAGLVGDSSREAGAPAGATLGGGKEEVGAKGDGLHPPATREAYFIKPELLTAPALAFRIAYAQGVQAGLDASQPCAHKSTQA